MALTKIGTGGIKDDAASQAAIADEAIDEARLQISNAGSNGQFLQKQSGNTGGLTWAAAGGASSIADDSIAEVKLDIHADPSGTDKFLAYTSNGMEWAVPTDTNTQLTTEQVEDIVGGMLDGTETGISVTYDDTDGNIDFVVGTLNQDTTGTAATATEATNVTVVANNSTDETVYPTFVDGVTGTQGIETDSGLTYNPSTGLLTAVGLTLSGDLTVNGTTTTINSTTLAVDDKNIELGSVDTPSDTTADGGGITLKGATDKTITWVDATDNWTFNQSIETTGAIKGNSMASLTGSLGVGTHTITSPNSVNRSIHVHNADHSSLVLSDDQNSWEIVSNNDLTVRDGTDTRLTINTTGNATFAGTVSDSKGNLRSIPRELKSSAYTIVLADAGKTIATNSGVTVPHNVMATGDAVTIVNNSGSDITITQASSLSMYNSADASTGNRTLAGRGMATIWFSSGAEAYISGAGLS